MEIEQLIKLTEQLKAAGRNKEVEAIFDIVKRSDNGLEEEEQNYLDLFKKDLLNALKDAVVPVFKKFSDNSPSGGEDILQEIESKVMSLFDNSSFECDDKLEGGKADEVDIDKINKKQLEMGKKVEMEHTNDPELAKEIALDHLVEQLEEGKDKSEQDYYTLLKEIESHGFISTKHLEKLSTMADDLDSIGAIKEADMIDAFIVKYAKSDKYDYKKHHSLIVNEPKNKHPNGPDKHHIENYQHKEEMALNTRYCPEHLGVQVGRIGENTYQCPIDGKIWEASGSPAGQTPDSTGYYAIPQRIFAPNENTLNVIH